MLIQSFIMLVTLTAVVAFGYDTLKLSTSLLPPYQVSQNDTLGGTSVEMMNCILNHMNVPYSYEIVPQKRAQLNVLEGGSSGYFSSMQFDRLDSNALLSFPLVLEKWYWFFAETTSNTVSSNDIVSMKIGCILGSNEEHWLMENGYPIKMRVHSLKQLIKLLKIGRIDTFVSDEKQFAIESESLELSGFNRKFLKYTPLGVYFSQKYLHSYPSFLDSFNVTIPFCAPNVLDLSSDEKEKLKVVGITAYKEIVRDRKIITGIINQNMKNRSISQREIRRLDSLWQSDKSLPKSPGKTMLNSSLSRFLREIKEQSNGQIAEIIVMDNRGLNVAVSDMTSDYWQGDELKYNYFFGKKSGKILIDDMKYDESTLRFQSQFSMPVYGSGNTKIGVVTIGLDIEQILSNHIALSNGLKDSLSSAVLKKIAGLLRMPEVITAIENSNVRNQFINEDVILKKDSVWKKEVEENTLTSIEPILNSTVSEELRQFKKKHHGLFTEILIMDDRGALVAISDVTSDYWQGDENKFLKTFPYGKNAVYVDDIRYDESTEMMQSQVSVSIADPVTGIIIGVITLGVDMLKF